MTTPPEFPFPRGRCPLHPPAGFEQARQHGPVSIVTLPTGRTAWLVTGYREARAMFANDALSPDPTNPDFPRMRAGGSPPPDVDVDELLAARRAGRSFNQLDDPEHAAHRRMVIPSFTVRRMRALRPRLREVTDGLLDRLVADCPPGDLVSGLALPFPALMFCELFGVDEADRAFFTERARLAVTDRMAGGAALIELKGYFDRVLRERAEAPGDDLLSSMTQRSGGLPHERLVNTALVTLVAGNESTLSMIALGTLALLAHPEQADVLRAGPAAASGPAVEELLRYLSVADTVPRVALADIEVAGQVIRAGDGVLLPTPAENRDPGAFPDPDVLDVRRAARHHIAFGHGIHQCVGQHLARVALEVVFTRLFERMPDLRLADPVDRQVIDGGVGVPRITTLRVAW